ncbi:glycosyltransferase family 4 protein [Terriglobus albidus]|uniref:glycosyltransferase family 4 protein n=1 Tax=Terriglobus albidus TaxID=1592106 RepID=UPI0021E07038|nr:glycosyltransferase family 4 protein [Terriglobus albidus]
MRILMTTDTVGGVWTFTRELVQGYLEAGCEVLLVSFGGRPSALQMVTCEELLHKSHRRFRYIPSELPLEWMTENGLVQDQAFPLLRSLAEDFGPQVIHSSQYCFGGLSDMVPTIVTAHSDVLSWAAACRKEELPASAWLHNYMHLVEHGLKKATAIVAPTYWMAQELERRFGYGSEAEVITNGRLLECDCAGPKAMQMITVGRIWDEAKGIHTLNDVTFPIPYVIAGSRQHESNRLQRIPGGATVLGPISAMEIIKLFSMSSIYLCSSIYEPFGLAPLEAALCGCALLLRDIPSLREVWQDAATYFSDPSELPALVSELSSDIEKLQKLQDAARNRAQLFNREQMVRGYLQLFNKFVSAAQGIRHAA